MSEQDDATTEAIGYTDVDGAGVDDLLLRMMDATAAWPSVRDLRRWSSDALLGGGVLDVGCGLAEALIDLASTGRGERFVGVDVSDDMLSEARRRVSEASLAVELRKADATDLPFDDDEFAGARSERMLQWVDEPVDAVAEMVRVTRPGGSVVLIDTDWRTMWTNIADQELEWEVHGHLPASWRQPAAGGFLTSYARSAGLVDVEARVVVHVATAWPGDGSTGLPPTELFVANMAAGGVRPESAQRWGDEVVASSERGDLFASLNLVGVRGRVPEA